MPASPVERLRPRRLRRGDRVAVVAPAGPVPRDQLAQGVAVLRSWGLQVDVAPHVLDGHPDLPYLAAPDLDRARDLQHAWCDPDVHAVLCARGGYGCLRLLDLLDWPAMAAARPKIFAGSSDVTALHEAMGRHLGVVTLFSPMIAGPSFADPHAREHLRRTLFEPESVRVLTRPGAGPLVAGRARGVTTGGNASLLVAGLGAWDAAAPPPGAVVLLEDVAEAPYRLDRMLTQLRRAGWFADAAGIALGSWTGCGESEAVRAVLADRLGDLGVPVIWELGFGHRDAPLTVPLGVLTELDADAGTLTVLDPALC
ncbi:S66 peptidase family protein [Gandjariella thermophila]|uniref:Putative carboxypeptidase n=1 Tax=Gandjariella thermophila TaxID=1931992 RepID=A0A4D4J3D3_9PSEU|nr:LD-carboxypeptidase [Gandjariella thermophila]GDY28503.1 putative carboxypeptidase [Gandjariella thermophila]